MSTASRGLQGTQLEDSSCCTTWHVLCCSLFTCGVIWHPGNIVLPDHPATVSLLSRCSPLLHLSVVS